LFTYVLFSTFTFQEFAYIKLWFCHQFFEDQLFSFDYFSLSCWEDYRNKTYSIPLKSFTASAWHSWLALVVSYLMSAVFYYIYNMPQHNFNLIISVAVLSIINIHNIFMGLIWLEHLLLHNLFNVSRFQICIPYQRSSSPMTCDGLISQ